jgi:hypothetical protein
MSCKRVKFNNKFLDCVPKEGFINIFLFLDGETLLTIYCTCKYFHSLLENSVFWKLKLEKTESFKELYKQ